MAGYLRPVLSTGLSSYWSHRLRKPPSEEPGTDYYCDIGTPVCAAAAGWIVDVGDSIRPATGRYVTIDLDDGRRVRYLHLKDRMVDTNVHVERGHIIGHSGATGYGTEDWSDDPDTGGAHVHMTIWPTQSYIFGRSGTLDPEVYMTETPTLFGLAPPEEEKEREMLLWHTTDMPARGGARDLWTVVHTGTSKLEQTRTQGIADRWARLYGNSREIFLDDLVHGIAQLAVLSVEAVEHPISDEELQNLADIVGDPNIDDGDVRTIPGDEVRGRLGL